ncbi:MAG TPA: helix-turn-helix domain-containing protein [Candidatus Thermoplasmatota archaeon]|nr:helix-turn-helix domain-containing protein [Candidatus Thermoplasmatota archaeon]
MRLTRDRLAVLLGFGLTEQQARAYLALLEHPALNVGALARVVRLPRNRAYEVVEQLEEKGLAEILLHETRMVRARPITDLVDSTLQQLALQADDLRARREALALAFEPPPVGDAGDAGATGARAIAGRRAVAREIDRLLCDARSSIVLAASRGGARRLIRHVEDAGAQTQERLAAGTLQLHLLLPASERGRGGLEPLLERLPVEAAWTQLELAGITVVADERECLLVRPMPDDDHLHAGGDRAYLFDDPAFAADHARLLLHARAAPLAAPAMR